MKRLSMVLLAAAGCTTAQTNAANPTGSASAIRASSAEGMANARIAGRWQPLASGTTAEFRGLSAPTETNAWASGTRGRFARTTDGGRTWMLDSIPGASGLDLRDIHALGPTTAWAMSAGPAEQDQAQIFRTDDGGGRWTRQLAVRDSGVFLDALAFWDAQHGIAMSDPTKGRLTIFVTDDGGANWSRVPMENAPAMLPGEAAFAASGTCLAIQGSSNVWIGTGGAARARVFRSTDRGRTWSVAETPVTAGTNASGIFSVAFADENNGIVVGGDYTKPKGTSMNVAITADGGRTWRRPIGSLPQGYMSGAAFVPTTGGRSVVAVGLGGTAISNDRGDTWTMVDTVGYNSVAFAARDVGWAVGPRGRISMWVTETR
jgi:photosystem II stability/assembly factor-like uncharacterized protein